MRPTRTCMVTAALMLLALPADAQQWTRVTDPTRTAIRALALTSDAVVAASDDGLYRSIDDGATWTRIDARGHSAVVAMGNRSLAAGSFDGRLIGSTDGGATWPLAYSGLPAHAAVRSLAFDGFSLVVGTNLGSYIVAADSLHASPMSLIGLGNVNAWGLARDGGGTVAATYSGPFGMSLTDTAWRRPASPPLLAFAAERLGSDVYIGTVLGVRRSSDDGATWTGELAGAPDSATFDLLASGPRLFAAGSAGVTVTTGNVWRAINEGLAPGHMLALAADTTTLWAASSAGAVYRRSIASISGLPHDERAGAALRIELLAPVPASRQLVVQWSSTGVLDARVRIVNELGETVIEAPDQAAAAGVRRTTIDVSSLPSGAYRCELTDGRGAARRMFIVAR